MLARAALPVGLALGVAVEGVFYDASTGIALTAGDFAVGCILIVSGCVAWERRPESRVGVLVAVAGATWFLGNVAGPLVYVHRGPLVQLHLSYPTGRVRARLAQAVVAAAYVDAVIEPLASNDVLTLVLSAAIALTAVRLYARSSGPTRRAGGPALAAALAFAGVLALGAVERLTAGAEYRHAVLWTYDAVVAGVALVLVGDLLRARWSEAVVTGLVVDLGAVAESGTLRTKLARALGDPSLVIAYRLPETGAFVDDAGRPVELPAPDSGRTVTPLADGGEETAVLVHDELVTDRYLLESVAAAARIAVSNARLQAEARSRAAELEASRRRIVEAADAQRRRLEQELRAGPEHRLEAVASRLAEVRAAAAEAVAELEAALAETRRELEELARGIHPSALTDGGLEAAFSQFALRAPVPVDVNVSVERLPAAIETALLFVCSEALANVAKHARASRAAIDVRADARRVELAVSDDGVGGAEPSRGSGLAGLADRVEALGGALRVESRAGAGTKVVATLPISEAA